MPLPKPQIDWVGRIAVLLIFGTIVASVFPLVWVFRALHTPDFVTAPVLVLWAMLSFLAALWVVAVWAPVRGKKFVENVLKQIW